jgi:hypothetical protein
MMIYIKKTYNITIEGYGMVLYNMVRTQFQNYSITL